MSKNQQIRYKYFKISVNFFIFSLSKDTKVFKIRNNATLVLLGIWYSLISFLFGWWGGSILKPLKNIRNTIEAIHINLTGGVDFTKEMDESEYDEKTNYIWNNLLRQTTEKISKNDVEIIVDIQTEFEQSNKDKYTTENIEFIIFCLKKIDIHYLTMNEIEDIFDAMKSYEINQKDQN